MNGKGIKLQDVQIDGNLFLAPLAGVTDVAFRCLARSYGAALTYTEMVSAKGMVYGNEKTEALLKTADNETVTAVQLFGSDAEIFKDAVCLPQIAKFDIIDINMGCPMLKVIKNGDGSALMKNIDGAARVIEACVKFSGKPVTVKFRKGYDAESVNAVEFASMCAQSGASMITVHGRTREDMYGGKCDLDVIGKVAAKVSIPVIGNGDVADRASYEKMLSLGCCGAMIGRAALGRPWIFDEILHGGCKIDRRAVILRHIALMEQHFPERYVVVNMRKHIAWYVKGMHGGIELKRRIFEYKTLNEVKNAITNSDIFS